MAEQLNKVAVEIDAIPQARVVYDPAQDILLIECGEKSAVGEEMAEGIIVHYNRDDESAPTNEAVRAVAIFIDGAETALKPFVDAILEKHGVKLGALQNGVEVNSLSQKSAHSKLKTD